MVLYSINSSFTRTWVPEVTIKHAVDNTAHDKA